jgi:hypothetical protein
MESVLRLAALTSLALACSRQSTDDASAASPNAKASLLPPEAGRAEPPSDGGAPPPLLPLAGNWLERVDLGDGDAAFVTVLRRPYF